MTTLPTTAAAAFIMLVLASTSPADAQANVHLPGAKFVNRLLTGGPRWAPVSTFDVAGVRLGMTPEEARVALESAGFSPQSTDPTQDAWSSVVSRRVAERGAGKADMTKVPRFTRASGPQGETVEVWYAPTEEGARATSINYTVPTKRMERSTFAADVSAKYGRPTVEEKARGLYCTTGEGSCLTYQNRVLPHLLVESSFALHSVKLMEGARYHDALKARTAAAVEAAAPKNAKASF